MPAAEVKGLRRRGASPERTHAEPADHAPSATTTAEKAVAYKPDVRVRMTVLRDYISIFRSRYMDSFFGLACAALACQLVLVAWRGLGVVEPELCAETFSQYAFREGALLRMLQPAIALVHVLLVYRPYFDWIVSMHAHRSTKSTT